MNNNYDREDAPKTCEETMEVTITDEDLIEEPKVNLFLLKSGETIISEFTLSLSAQTYFFEDPRVVMIQSSSGDGDSTQTTIAYSDWMPLSKGRSYTVSSDWVVCRTEPLESLVESYLNNKNG